MARSSIASASTEHTDDDCSVERGDNNGEDLHLRRHQSAMAHRVQQLRQAGGANSLDNFARSWQRAAGFFEVTPVRPAFRYEDDEEGSEDDYGRRTVQSTPRGKSLLAAAIERDSSRNRASSRNRVVDDERQPLIERERDFVVEPSIRSGLGGSYGTSWGSGASTMEPSHRHPPRSLRPQIQSVERNKEREPLRVRQVQEDDGTVVNVVVGQSTLPQMIFNSANVLIGIGLLALPLALRLAGWIPGLIFLCFAAAATSYTAKLLAKCADVDISLVTFADLAFVSFGQWARAIISLLFCLELVAACVAFVVLFADSLNALIPGWGVTEWKLLCGLILIPFGFVPLRFLSFTSILGIFSCSLIVLTVWIDGLVKPHHPGSIHEPARTYMWPEDWKTLPVSFGILMSPWGGHAVFPNIYRDMRKPYKYRRGVNITYMFAFTIDISMAVIGYLMFGDGVADEITRNILTTQGYPHFLNMVIIVCVAIIPVTKIPLNAHPIVSTLEVLLGLDQRALANAQPITGMTGYTRGILRFVLRVACPVVFVLLAILVPQFDTIMSLMGAIACFTVCIILPCAFHLKLYWNTLSPWHRIMDIVLIGISAVLAVVGTASNFLVSHN
ncbi:hypothetical protein K470DRAFT_256495 [Piedraia hortae CBS 480.64]|uniref:Amino acid transporter transmembrane domain-containing protein n=1 Tax=Piedraia hortae CBS 480.64 TaxID=1314780 RepID=A0A6A7C3Z4_9PEZI|nr:hypothetical protein K470DRAFT_256495 [Piedraia hortae CBS 480.64]